MAQAAEKIDGMNVPDGGIANFIMDDDEAEAIYGNDDVEEYGSEGIAQFSDVAKEMAAKGREGDDVIAHLQTGELVIPKQLLDENPEMKETLFAFLEGQGIEDPERYVVGTDANSINPETGVPEFFFKKVFRKIVSGVKKVVKSVVKVVKKVAPIVLPIALAFTPLGPIYGAALGSGIGTLIQGGSIKDALKSALISGATGALASGFTGQGTFLQNVQSNLADPIGRFAQTASGAQTSLQNVFGGEAARTANAGRQTFFSQYQAPAAQGVVDAAGSAETVRADATSIAPEQTAATDALRVQDTSVARVNTTTAPVEVTLANGAGQTIPPGGQIPAGATVNPTLAPSAAVYEPPSFMESIKGAFTPGDDIGFMEGMKNAFFPGGPTAAQTTQIGNQAYTQAYNNAMALPGMTPELAAQQATTAMNAATASAGPGFLRTYGPLAAAGTALAAGTGMFTPPEPEPLDIVQRDAAGNVITGEDLVAGDPSKYLVGELGDLVLDPNTGQYVPRGSIAGSSFSVPTQYGFNYLPSSPTGGPFQRPVQRIAEGGEVFPRRNGGIMPDEGIPGQDSVRAMLMPGEFVMTTDAVRGLGNGNLNRGIKNMYSVMRNLESRGRAMA